MNWVVFCVQIGGVALIGYGALLCFSARDLLRADQTAPPVEKPEAPLTGHPLRLAGQLVAVATCMMLVGVFALFA